MVCLADIIKGFVVADLELSEFIAVKTSENYTTFIVMINHRIINRYIPHNYRCVAKIESDRVMVWDKRYDYTININASDPEFFEKLKSHLLFYINSIMS
jgi:hypothetical protein